VTRNRQNNPARIAEQRKLADQVHTTLRELGFDWSISRVIRTLHAYNRNIAGRMPLDEYLVLRIGFSESRQAAREALRAALWYTDQTGITATLNADQGNRRKRPSQQSRNCRKGNTIEYQPTPTTKGTQQ
jgi:hypothetical protein